MRNINSTTLPTTLAPPFFGDEPTTSTNTLHHICDPFFPPSQPKTTPSPTPSDLSSPFPLTPITPAQFEQLFSSSESLSYPPSPSPSPSTPSPTHSSPLNSSPTFRTPLTSTPPPPPNSVLPQHQPLPTTPSRLQHLQPANQLLHRLVLKKNFVTSFKINKNKAS